MTDQLTSLLLRLLVVAALLFLVLPLMAIVPLSLTDQRMLSLPAKSLSFQHYRETFSNQEWAFAALTSLKVAVVSTLISVSMGTAGAIGCWMTRGPQIFRTVYLLPLVIPYIIVALGAYRLFAYIGLLDTFFGVVIAHVVGSIPFVFVAVSTSLEHLDKSIVSAARSLGAGPFRCAITITLPNIWLGVMSGALFAFLHSWDEIVVTLFISGRHLQTLPRKMWEGLNDNLDPAIACVAVALVGTSLLLIIIHQLLTESRKPA